MCTHPFRLTSVTIGPLVNAKGLCIEWADKGIFCDLTETEFEIDHLKFDTKGDVEHSVKTYSLPKRLPAGIAFLRSLLTMKVPAEKEKDTELVRLKKLQQVLCVPANMFEPFDPSKNAFRTAQNITDPTGYSSDHPASPPLSSTESTPPTLSSLSLLCGKCGRSKPKESYSKSQLKKKERRWCNDCLKKSGRRQ